MVRVLNRLNFSGLLLLMCLASSSVLAQQSAAVLTPENQALKVARAWLALVDAGAYSRSWRESASLLKSAIEQQQWAKTIKVVRQPLGDLFRRRVISAKYTTSLPGAPDGEYVVIQFKTAFQNKREAIETITPMKDSDGQWRVSGYFIK